MLVEPDRTRYDLNFRLRYQDYVDLNGISDFEYFANAKSAWRVTDNTRIELSDDFVSTSSASRSQPSGSENSLR